jgi:hypothetical protein
MRRMGQRFVILRHSVNGGEHFDLMLELPGQQTLRTIQFEKWPIEPGQRCPAREIQPHRRVYLDYEGEISGGRGHVRRVAGGEWTGTDANMALGADIHLAFGGAEIRRL